MRAAAAAARGAARGRPVPHLLARRLATAVAGLVVLAALVPRREQLRGCGLVPAAARGGGAVGGLLPGRRTPAPTERRCRVRWPWRPWWWSRRRRRWSGGSSGRSPGEAGRGRNGIGRPAAVAVAAAVMAALVVVGVTGLGDGAGGAREDERRGSEPARIGRERALRVLARGGSAFADHPLRGIGAGGFAVEWRRERPAGSAPAADAHSLYLESAAELGARRAGMPGALPRRPGRSARARDADRPGPERRPACRA